MKSLALILTVAASLLSHATAAEQTLPADHARFFEAKVRPLLAEHCWKCHGPEAQKGELRLDSLAGVLAGGESGAVVVPGEPDGSVLLEAVRYESFEMPPNGKLSDAEIETLATWVKLGVPWPGQVATAGEARPAGEKFTDEDRDWWAFQPVRDVPPPEITDGWVRNDIDRFVLRSLSDNGLTPAPEADRVALLRRLCFDLTGLPPSEEQLDEFLTDTAPQAYERLVDRLLASPRYGERAARQWLDLVRYADSDGYRIDNYRPTAWRYRDYVIAALNADKPYDRFVQEQLAGDELFPGDPEALVATGYLRHGIYEYNSRDVRGQWDIMLNEVTDTTGDVFLGLGMQCARCHDHKFDPILQKDYFRLRAFFEPLLPRDDVPAATANQLARSHAEAAEWETRTAAVRAALDTLEDRYRDRGERAAIAKFPEDIQAMIRKPESERTPQEAQFVALAWRQVVYEYGRIDDKFNAEDKEKILALRRELAAFDALRPPAPPEALTATDVGPIAPPTVIPKKRTVVEPGFLTLLEESPAEVAPPDGLKSTGRRSALALWLTRPDNPLATRVIVNRIWQGHFGRGLAANASDFGRLGEAPTHPELLDWLTSRFLEGGWRLKPLHRLIVTSATYRQSATHDRSADYTQRDPANHWYWRADTRRLDAEQIRDAVLAVTGRLDLKAGGPGVPADQPRRSIYTRVMRNSRDPLLDAFDLPLFFSSAASRDTTTSPLQSLLLINSPTMLRHAEALAGQARKTASATDPAAAVQTVYRRALGREPTSEERRRAEAFLEAQPGRINAAEPAEAGATQRPTGKMPYRDGQAVSLEPTGKLPGLSVPHRAAFDVADFTIEAYFQIRSVSEGGEVRVIAAKADGNSNTPGWTFGVTGKGSRRKPQTLVLQLFGDRTAGGFGEAALFSDQHIELNTPYFAAAAIHLAGEGPGRVTFLLKDLSNDDEPLLSATVEHTIHGGFGNGLPFSIGRRASASHRFHGLIDDVRLSRGALEAGGLLFTTEGVAAETIGYWQFEAEPGLLRDTTAHGLDIEPTAATSQMADPKWQAFTDLCHVLLNANEFLYVH